MRAVLTRVKSASVAVDGKTIGQIGQGFLILLGITHDDTEAQAVKLPQGPPSGLSGRRPAGGSHPPV